MVILFVVGFATGPGSIPWFFVTELFNQSARGMATSIAVVTNWSANFLVGLLFPPLQVCTFQIFYEKLICILNIELTYLWFIYFSSQWDLTFSSFSLYSKHSSSSTYFGKCPKRKIVPLKRSLHNSDKICEKNTLYRLLLFSTKYFLCNSFHYVLGLKLLEFYSSFYCPFFAPLWQKRINPGKIYPARPNK